MSFQPTMTGASPLRHSRNNSIHTASAAKLDTTPLRNYNNTLKKTHPYSEQQPSYTQAQPSNSQLTRNSRNNSIHTSSAAKLDTTPLKSYNNQTKQTHPYSEQYNNVQSYNQTQSTLHLTRQKNQSSPALNISIDELEFYRNECHQMDAQIAYLKKELDVQFLKNTKINTLEQKVDVIFAQNQSLQIENEKLQRIGHQYKNECQLWKQKYESYMQSTEMEIQSLNNQIQELLFKCEEIENARLMREHEIEQAYNSVELIRQELIIKDSEIGKLYAVVNDQSAEISELTSRLDKLRQDTEYDSYKNSKEIDHWKRQLTMLKKSKQEELQQRMAELENYHNEQSEQLEQKHQEEVGQLKDETNNLKALLGIKNEEIESLIQQNVKTKQHAEQCEQNLLEQIDDLKEEMVERSKQANKSKEEALRSLQEQFENQTQQVAQQFHTDENNYQQQINQLADELDKKERDKANIQNRLTDLTSWFDGEVGSMKDTIERMRKEGVEQEQRILSRDALIQQKQRERDDLQHQMFTTESNYKLLIDEERRRLQEKEDELECAFEEFTQIKSQLEEQILYLKQELELFKNKFYEMEKNKNKDIEDLQIKNSQLEIQLREKVKILEVQIEFLNNELRRIKELLERKISECEQHYTAKIVIERENRKIRDENEELKQKISDFEEWKAFQESSSGFQIDQLRLVQSQQLEKYQREYRDLQGAYESKCRDCDENNHRLLLLEQALTDVKNKRGGSPIKIQILQSEMRVKRSIYNDLGRSPAADKENL